MTSPLSENVQDTIQRIRSVCESMDFEEWSKAIVSLFWDLFEVRPDIEELETWITNQEANILEKGKDIDLAAVSSNLASFLSFIGRAYGCSQDDSFKIETIGTALNAAACGLDFDEFANQIENWVDLIIECAGSRVQLPVTIEDDQIRVGRHCKISFKRTLRIPEDGKDYPLPADFGRLPIHRVEDYAEKVPDKWLSEGGFFVPLYQKEALFLEFEGKKWRPCAAKIAVGRVNAVTGDKYDEKIRPHKQDYVVIPDQKWLDGINSGDGRVGQFVAMPLGKGFTVEAQVTDEEVHGGFQLTVFDPKKDRFTEEDPEQLAMRKMKLDQRKSRPDQLMSRRSSEDAITSTDAILSAPGKQDSGDYDIDAQIDQIMSDMEGKEKFITQLQKKPDMGEAPEPNCRADSFDGLMARGDEPQPNETFDDIDALLRELDAEIPGYESTVGRKVVEMGIAKGGSIKQAIVEDTYGSESWDEGHSGSIVIHLVNSEVYQIITGKQAPPTPVTAEQYAKHDIPWFDYYDESVPALAPAKPLQYVRSIGAMEMARGISSSISVKSIPVLPERLRKIKTPSQQERIADFVQRAERSNAASRYQVASREATFAIDMLFNLATNENNALLEKALQHRAEANFFLSRFLDAEGDATECLKLNSLNLPALTVRAHALVWIGEHELAISDAKQLLSLSPVNAEGLRVLAEAYLQTGDNDQAISNASALLKHLEKDAIAYRIRAEAQLNNEKYADCMKDATAALIYGGFDVRVLLARAKAFIALGNSYDARQDAEDILRIDADNEEARLVLTKLPKEMKERRH